MKLQVKNYLTGLDYFLLKSVLIVTRFSVSYYPEVDCYDIYRRVIEREILLGAGAKNVCAKLSEIDDVLKVLKISVDENLLQARRRSLKYFDDRDVVYKITPAGIRMVDGDYALDAAIETLKKSNNSICPVRNAASPADVLSQTLTKAA